MHDWANINESELSILQFFGQAEIDAACLFALARDAQGRPLYQPRDGVSVRVSHGQIVPENGVSCHRLEGHGTATAGGLVIEDHARWAPLHCKNSSAGHRRTGIDAPAICGSPAAGSSGSCARVWHPTCPVMSSSTSSPATPEWSGGRSQSGGLHEATGFYLWSCLSLAAFGENPRQASPGFVARKRPSRSVNVV